MTTIDLAGPAIAAAAGAAAAGAAAQAVTGFGFSLVAAPVFVLLVGPVQAVRLTNVFAAIVNALLLAREHRELKVGLAARLLLPAAIITPMAAWAVHRTDPAVLSVIVGVMVVVCALALMSGRRAQHLRGGKGLIAAGAISAAMNTTSGVGGPAVAMYALNADWSSAMTRPTLALFFVGLNVMSLAALGLVSMPAEFAASMVVATGAGFGLGMILLRRLSAAAVGRGVLLVSIAGGLAAAVRGILSL